MQYWLWIQSLLSSVYVYARSMHAVCTYEGLRDFLKHKNDLWQWFCALTRGKTHTFMIIGSATTVHRSRSTYCLHCMRKSSPLSATLRPKSNRSQIHIPKSNEIHMRKCRSGSSEHSVNVTEPNERINNNRTNRKKYGTQHTHTNLHRLTERRNTTQNEIDGANEVTEEKQKQKRRKKTPNVRATEFLWCLRGFWARKNEISLCR